MFAVLKCMSTVTDIIITCGLSEGDDDDHFPPIEHINRYLESDGRGALAHLNGHEGGTKEWQVNVFGGAFNHLRLEGFAEVLRSAPWSEPDRVTIFIQLEEDETMREVLLTEPAPNRGADWLRRLLTSTEQG